MGESQPSSLLVLISLLLPLAGRGLRAVGVEMHPTIKKKSTFAFSPSKALSHWAPQPPMPKVQLKSEMCAWKCVGGKRPQPKLLEKQMLSLELAGSFLFPSCEEGGCH